MSSDFNSNSQWQVQTQVQTQTQTLSPQQVLEVKLLELSAIELEERVRDELLDNPALEEKDGYDDADADSEDVSDTETDEWGEQSGRDDRDADFISDDDMPDYYRDPAAGRSASAQAAEIPFSDAYSFYDILIQQLNEQDLSGTDRQIAEYLIGSLDDNGFLTKSLDSVSTEIAVNLFIDANIPDVERVLDVIQQFDPAGIGARDLQECLLLQLNRKEENDTCVLAKRIIGECFDDFKNLRRDRIAARLNMTDGELDAALNLISHLNPRPGCALGESDRQGSHTVIPDFIVESYDGTVQFSLNRPNVPELRVSKSFYDTLNARADSTDSSVRQEALFIRRKIDAARGFIDAVRQREQTLTRTMGAIIDMQQEYFLTGDDSRLRPMILKDVAQRTGLDISTISRATSGKYAETDFGIVSLKELFTDGIVNSDGVEVSVREIHRIIREAVESEPKSAPLTDDALSEILRKQGYEVARRTVAKYRDQLGIPVSRLRK